MTLKMKHFDTLKSAESVAVSRGTGVLAKETVERIITAEDESVHLNHLNFTLPINQVEITFRALRGKRFKWISTVI